MPIIQVEGPRIDDREGKRRLCRELTDVAVRAFPHIGREHFIVLLKENPAENVAVGGELVADRIARRTEEAPKDGS